MVRIASFRLDSERARVAPVLPSFPGPRWFGSNSVREWFEWPFTGGLPEVTSYSEELPCRTEAGLESCLACAGTSTFSAFL